MKNIEERKVSFIGGGNITKVFIDRLINCGFVFQNNILVSDIKQKVLVEDEDTAKKVSFRGSPTLLINGADIDGVSAPSETSLSCRFYINGIPTPDKIRTKIIEKINTE